MGRGDRGARTVERVTRSGQARFPALRVPNYRLFWIGGLVTNNGRWVTHVTSAYVTYRITGSAAWVGVTGFATFVPMLLLNPVSGHISDTRRRRNVLFVTNAAYGGVAVVMASAWAAGMRSPTGWVLLFFASGCVAGVQLPVWQAFVAECVPKDLLRNAITLNSTQFNAARTVGPAIGGLLIGTLGPGWAFLTAALFVGPVLVCLSLMDPAGLHRPEDLDPADRGVRAVLTGYRDSIRYVRDSPGIRTAVLTITLVMTVTAPISQQVVVFAEEVFTVSPFWFGVLASAQGIGAVLSAPVVAGELDRVQRSRLQFGAVLGYAACVAVLGLAPAFWMGFLALAALGAVHLTSASNLNSVVQLQVDDAVRGRVMAIYLMGVLGTAPFANLLMGWLIAVFDVRPVVVGGGVLLLVAALFLAGSGRLRHLDA